VFPSHVFYLKKTFELVKKKKSGRKEKLRCHKKREKEFIKSSFHTTYSPKLYTQFTLLHTQKTSSLIIINVINQSINKTQKTLNFLLTSYPILGLNAYSSPDQDKPGLTRLTWNTDWAFLDKQTKKNKLSTIAAGCRIFLLTHTTHPNIMNFYYFTTMFYIKWVILQQK